MAEAIIRISGKGINETRKKIDRLGTSTRKLGKQGAIAGRRMSAGFGGLQGLAGNLGLAFGAAGVAAGARKVLAFNDIVGDLQVAMRLSNKDAEKLETQLIDMGRATGLGKDGIASILTVFQDFGGIAKVGLDSMEKIAMVTRSFRSAPEGIARTGAALVQLGKIKPENLLDAFAAIEAGANAGNIKMDEMNRVMPKLIANMSKFGTGKEAIREMVTMFQMIGALFPGQAEQAETAFKAIMKTFTSGSKKLAKFGIATEAGGKMKSPTAMFTEMFQKMGTSSVTLSDVFEGEALDAMTTIIASYDKDQKKLSGKFSEISDAVGKASESDVYAAYKLRIGGVAKESEKLKETIASLDAQFTKILNVLIGFAGKSPLLAAGAAGAGMLAARALPGMLMGQMRGLQQTSAGLPQMQIDERMRASGRHGRMVATGAGSGPGRFRRARGGMNQALGSMFGLGTAGAGAGIKANKLGAGLVALQAGAAGFAAGKLFDELINELTGKAASTWAADIAFDWTQKLKTAVGMQSDTPIKQTDIQRQTLLNQARNLSKLSSSGLTQFQGQRGGEMVALNQQNAMDVLERLRTSIDVSDEKWRTLMPELTRALGKVPSQPMQVNVASAGTDKLTVKQSQGAF